MSDDAEYKTAQGMAEHLALSVGKLMEMVETGAIPATAFFKHNRTYRFHVTRVEQALLDGTAAKDATNVE